jgi:histidine ammonia-lyase
MYLVELMTELINRNIIPLIYEHGGVGASGDLVQWRTLHWFLLAKSILQRRAKEAC